MSRILHYPDAVPHEYSDFWLSATGACLENFTSSEPQRGCQHIHEARFLKRVWTAVDAVGIYSCDNCLPLLQQEAGVGTICTRCGDNSTLNGCFQHFQHPYDTNLSVIVTLCDECMTAEMLPIAAKPESK